MAELTVDGYSCPKSPPLNIWFPELWAVALDAWWRSRRWLQKPMAEKITLVQWTTELSPPVSWNLWFCHFGLHTPGSSLIRWVRVETQEWDTGLPHPSGGAGSKLVWEIKKNASILSAPYTVAHVTVGLNKYDSGCVFGTYLTSPFCFWSFEAVLPRTVLEAGQM